MSSLPRHQSSSNGLSLASEVQPKLNADQLKMERRRCPRRQMEEVVTAVYSQGRERVGLTRVLVTDASYTGLGLKCEAELEPGMRLTLTTHGIPMPHKAGTVVRCVREESGLYSIGLSLDKPKAA